MMELFSQIINFFSTSTHAIAGIIGGVTGGIITTFANNYIWRSHTNPTLKLGEISKNRELNSSGETGSITYLLQVKNTGRSSATNCTGKMHFRGQVNSIEGIDGREIEIETSLIWQDREIPNRKLNRGDKAYLELFKWIIDDGNGIMFPSDSGWEEGARINIEPGGDIPPLDGEYPRKRIHYEAFRNTNWYLTDIRITGELAKPVESEIDIRFENDDLLVRLKDRGKSGNRFFGYVSHKGKAALIRIKNLV